MKPCLYPIYTIQEPPCVCVSSHEAGHFFQLPLLGVLLTQGPPSLTAFLFKVFQEGDSHYGNGYDQAKFCY